MNAVAELMNQPLAHRLGWVLLHSIWQGAVAAAIFAGLRSGLRRGSANARYLAACGLLLALAAAPVITFLSGTTTPLSSPMGSASGFSPRIANAAAVVSGRALLFGTGGAGPTGAISLGMAWLEKAVPWVVSFWALGVAIFSCRLLHGCWWVRRLRTRKAESLDEFWRVKLAELRRRLQVSRPVRLLKSALVEVPTVVGWLRPVILLPASTLAGLTPAQLEAILAHELAHVRRHDYLVNAFQTVVETLMFYHPAVWWISGCIREEREHCCDDLVVRACGDRLGYARALATLEELRGEIPQLAFAAAGGSLLRRIRRLLGALPDSRPTSGKELGGLALLGLGVVLVLAGVCLALGGKAYLATNRIRVERDLSVQLSSSDGRATLSVMDPYFMQTEMEVIRSEPVLEKAVDLLDLKTKWSEKYAPGQPLNTREAARILRARLDVRPVRNANIVEIGACSEQAEEAARIANGVARAYTDFHWEQRHQMAEGGLAALEKRAADQEKKIRESQAQVDALRVELKIPDAQAGENHAPMLSAETLRRIEGLRIESQAEWVSQKTLLDKLKALTPEERVHGLSTAVQDSLLNSLLEQLSLADARLVAVKKEFGPEHTQVMTLTAQVEDLQRKIRDRTEGLLVGMEAKVESLKERLNNLSNEVDKAAQIDLEKATQNEPYWAAKRNLEELIRFRQALYMKIASERTDFELPKNPVVAVLEQAVPPPRPFSPNYGRAGALMGAGLLLAVLGMLMIRTGQTAASPLTEE